MNPSERARLDYEWSHMNAVERTEALRARVEALEGFKRDRISTHYEGDDCPGGHLTPDEIARLRRIEEAARDLASQPQSAFLLEKLRARLSWYKR